MGAKRRYFFGFKTSKRDEKRRLATSSSVRVRVHVRISDEENAIKRRRKKEGGVAKGKRI